MRRAEKGLGSLNFGGRSGSTEGPEPADFANPQTLEEIEGDTPQPPATGGDLVDMIREERG